MPSFCAAAAIGLTGNPTIPNMNLTLCCLRLLATKVAPSTSLMSALLSEPDHRREEAPLEAGPGKHVPRTLERSEEHTSELQSQSNIVCRLLLEKKKKTTKKYSHRRVP